MKTRPAHSINTLIVALLFVAFAAPQAATAQNSASGSEAALTKASMTAIVNACLPGREPMNDGYSGALFEALTELGVETNGELAGIIEKYQGRVLKAEKRICREILENGESGDGFVARPEEMPDVERGIFFTRIGFMRELLVTKFGPQYEQVIRNGNYNDPGEEEAACGECRAGGYDEEPGLLRRFLRPRP